MTIEEAIVVFLGLSNFDSDQLSEVEAGALRQAKDILAKAVTSAVEHYRVEAATE